MSKLSFWHLRLRTVHMNRCSAKWSCAMTVLACNQRDGILTCEYWV